MTFVFQASAKTALIVIDVQQGFDDEHYWGKRNNPQAEERIAELLAHWRAKERPVIHVQHASLEAKSPLRKDSPGFAFKPCAEALANELIFEKNVNSAFIGTGLEQHLRDEQIQQLVIAGLTTDHCVSTSTRMAGNLGFQVCLIEDACACFDRASLDGALIPAVDIHRIHLASLHNEFCQVVSSQQILAQID